MIRQDAQYQQGLELIEFLHGAIAAASEWRR